ncbi:hypothetical protein LCGC14_2175930 [marine sediment metagenome]|uniref:Uncharacterized protein n=1 Tax=marine sediment metagenome TaxID=412755 RepID=A0A0F9EAZ0_9ZZZZ
MTELTKYKKALDRAIHIIMGERACPITEEEWVNCPKPDTKLSDCPDCWRTYLLETTND